MARGIHAAHSPGRGGNCATARCGENTRVSYRFLTFKMLFARRRRDFDALQDTWQAQGFVRVAKSLAGVVGLKRV